MSTYPNDHVYIMKVKYHTFLAFLANQDNSRVKFFHNGAVVSASELKSYIRSQYGQNPEWIRCMDGENHFCEHPKVDQYRVMRCGYTPTYEETSIRSEISKAVGYKPSENLSDYESDNDDFRSYRREQKALQARMDRAMDAYNANASQYPSFERYDSVTDSEIYAVTQWFYDNDRDRGPQTPNYGSVLDF